MPCSGPLKKPTGFPCGSDTYAWTRSPAAASRLSKPSVMAAPALDEVVERASATAATRRRRALTGTGSSRVLPVLVGPPVALAFDVVPRGVSETGRADDQEL